MYDSKDRIGDARRENAGLQEQIRMRLMDGYSSMKKTVYNPTNQKTKKVNKDASGK